MRELPLQFADIAKAAFSRARKGLWAVVDTAHRGHRPDCDTLVHRDAAAVSHVQAVKQDARGRGR